MIPEYTLLSAVSVVAVIAAELLWWRTGLFRTVSYWVSMAIVFFFQVLVDGVLTKLPHAVVIYDEGEFSGIRFPWDIPVEDYLFGFSLVTLAMLLWDVAGRRVGRGSPAATGTLEES